MKNLTLIALALLSISAFSLTASAATPNYARIGDEIQFTRDVVFSNVGNPEAGLITVEGKQINASYTVLCRLRLEVPANSKWTVKAGRSLKVLSASGTLQLDGGVVLSCWWAYNEWDNWQDSDGAYDLDFADIMRSLPMLKIKRQQLPPPDDKEV